MHLVPGSGMFWTPRRAAAFVAAIFPEEPRTDFDKNIELLAASFWVTPDELKEFIDPRSVARRADLTEEAMALLVPPAVQTEMDEILKSIKGCERCGRRCGTYCNATRHLFGWELVD